MRFNFCVLGPGGEGGAERGGGGGLLVLWCRELIPFECRSTEDVDVVVAFPGPY